MTGYIFYSNDVRPSLMKEFPDLKMGDLSKKIGAMWKEVRKSKGSSFYATIS